MERTFVDFNEEEQIIKIYTPTKDIEIEQDSYNYIGKDDRPYTDNSWSKKCLDINTGNKKETNKSSEYEKFNLSSDEFYMDIEFFRINDLYTDLLDIEKERLESLTLEEKKKEIIFNCIRSLYFNSNEYQKIEKIPEEISIRTKLFENDETVFNIIDNSPSHYLNKILEDLNINENLDECMNTAIKETIKNQDAEKFFIVNSIIEFNLLEEIIEDFGGELTSGNIDITFKGLLENEILNMLIFKDDEGVIATNGNVFLKLKNSYINDFEEEDEFGDCITHINIGLKSYSDFGISKNEDILINSMKFKADLDNLKIIEILNHGNDDFILYGKLKTEADILNEENIIKKENKYKPN